MKKFLFLFLFFNCYSQDCEVAICTVFQNEAPYLREWIEYHRLIGVEHFYLYNHYGTDNFREVLTPYIEEGVVELFDWMEKPNSQNEFGKMQVCVFKHTVKKASCQWLAFIDTDEFILLLEDDSLPQFLEKYEAYGAVTMNWQIFGTSNIQKLDPEQLMIEQLVFKAEEKSPWNKWVKSIVQLKYLDWSKSKLNVYGNNGWSPHFFPVLPQNPAVNSRFKPVKGFTDATIPTEIIRLNHYTFRDEEHFYKTKLNRIDCHPSRKKTLLRKAEESNCVEDRSILIHAEELRESVFK